MSQEDGETNLVDLLAIDEDIDGEKKTQFVYEHYALAMSPRRDRSQIKSYIYFAA
jgi:hypothetical protein